MGAREELVRLAESRPELADLVRESLETLDKSESLSEIEDVRFALLGRKGCISEIFKHLSDVPAEDRSEIGRVANMPVSYTHLRAHETRHDLVCRLLLEKKKKKKKTKK